MARGKLRNAPSKPVVSAALTVAPPLAAATPRVAALADMVKAGNAASTPSVKALPGLERSSAPSTNASTCPWSSLRPRESRCLATSAHGAVNQRTNQRLVARHDPAESLPVPLQALRNEFRITAFCRRHHLSGQHITLYVAQTSM